METKQHGGQVPHFLCQFVKESVTYDFTTREIRRQAYMSEASGEENLQKKSCYHFTLTEGVPGKRP